MDNTKVIITPLGAGNEVGRSCLHIQYMDTQVLLDCGVHPAYTGFSSLPFLDLIDLSKIDAVFITHFHLDHGGALPFLTERTSFKGKVYMTHPTYIILKWLLNDYIRILNTTTDTDINDHDLKSCSNKITCIDYYQEIKIGNMKITALNAGHVLGAAMFQIEIKRTIILYTGDYSREEDRHLKAADLPNKKVDILIAESTYGVGNHLCKKERENRLIEDILSVLEKKGRVLLPVFALGRAQELLLILEEFWEINNLTVPIFYVSALAKKCMNVYQTYLNMMNDRIRKIGESKNPFLFKYVKNIQSIDNFKDESCVMVASPGMLQSGTSRELFEKWCEDRNNGIVITGYCVSGTLAKEILSEPTHITSLSGQKLSLRMKVSFISFSAHVDFMQNAEFIGFCNPKFLVFMHGEANEMNRLRNAILHRNGDIDIQLLKNGESGSYPVEEDLNARINSNLLRKNLEFSAILAIKYDAEIIENTGLEFKERKIIHVFDSSLKKTMLLSFFCDFNEALKLNYEVEGDNIIYFKNIKILFEKNEVILEWVGSFESDLTALTIARIIEQDTLEIVKYSSRGEATINLLRNYYDIDIKNDVVIVKDGKYKAEICNGIVNGDENIIERVRYLVNIVNKIYD